MSLLGVLCCSDGRVRAACVPGGLDLGSRDQPSVVKLLMCLFCLCQGRSLASHSCGDSRRAESATQPWVRGNQVPGMASAPCMQA